MEKQNSLESSHHKARDLTSHAAPAALPPVAGPRQPFLRVPPFPGAKVQQIAKMGRSGAEVVDLTGKVRSLRVGGTYWAAQPTLPADCIVVRSPSALETARRIACGRPIVLWSPSLSPAYSFGAQIICGDCDPWHIVEAAAAVVVEASDELRLIASLAGVPVFLFDPATGQAASDDADPAALLAGAIGACRFENPFNGEPMYGDEAVELCGFWRSLIDLNRDVVGGLGFAFWKQDHIAALLWNGSTPFCFLRSSAEVPPQFPVAVWYSKVSRRALEELERGQNQLFEVEDGFLRSRGLGADCIPPLSITVDRLGAYFDPTTPTELELLLQDSEFDDQILARARELRRIIVEAGIGKYGKGTASLDRRARDRRHVLVAGQVEDDRAVQLGGCGLSSNLELLGRVRAEAPDAYILYKPHPDVVAGHRRGAIADRACLEFADEIVGDVPIAALIAMVDEVHVNTSLAGFEALLREKAVTTYGVPFYAGWGLTRDLGPVPARRTARRSLDELIAATLLIYPRYLDPVTGLPCPAEVLVERLSVRDEREPGLLVGMRRLQGALMRRLRSLGL
jgi:capsular polysaccharide export protein